MKLKIKCFFVFKIPADHLSGDRSLAEFHRILNDVEANPPRLKLLYITPEKISASNRIQETFECLSKRNQLARFVIDEAHCVSNWGHDFRPDYKKLNILRIRFPNVPIMALTATATRRVQSDILKQLCIENCKWFLCSFNRPNLQYFVKPKKSAATAIDDILKTIKEYRNASGIVYCLSRNDCDTVAQKLCDLGVRAVSYHAGLSDKKRENVQKDWITERFKVICATIAFGMGIDKPDVRYVLHYSIPKSIEGYYQESGRAGRDGEKSICILYYNNRDMMIFRKMLDSKLRSF